MKAILVTGVAGLVIIGGLTLVPNVQESIKETVEIEKIVTPDWAQDEEAVQAAKDVIRRKELEVEEARLIDEIKSRQSELDTIRKELGTY